MNSLDALAPDQRAVVQLVLQQGRSYNDLARLLNISDTAVRDRAHRGLDLLVPGSDATDDDRALVADYLLGQADADACSRAQALLAADSHANEWALDVASALDRIAPGRVPEIPEPPADAAGDEEPNGTVVPFPGVRQDEDAPEAEAAATDADAALGAGTPEAGEPGAVEPEAGVAEADEPAAGVAEADEPGAVEPEAGVAEADASEAGEPGGDAWAPSADEPAAGVAEADEPDADEPAAGVAEANEPDADEPVAAVAEATASEAGEPCDGEPEAGAAEADASEADEAADEDLDTAWTWPGANDAAAAKSDADADPVDEQPAPEPEVAFTPYTDTPAPPSSALPVLGPAEEARERLRPVAERTPPPPRQAPRQTAPPPEPPRREPSRPNRIKLAIAGFVGIAVVLLLVALLAGGGDDEDKAPDRAGTESRKPAAPAPPPQTDDGRRLIGETRLAGEGPADGASAVVRLLQRGEERSFTLAARGVPASRRNEAYAVWLYTDRNQTRRLGFTPTVDDDGMLQTQAALPADASRYRELLVTRETSEDARTPGTPILRGPLSTKAPAGR